MNDFIDRCRAKGIKLTAQRRFLAQVLVNEPGPSDAEQVHALALQRGARLSLSTVYRALGLFRDADLIVERMCSDGRRRYKLAGRLDRYHLIDDARGTNIAFFDPVLERLHQRVAFELGFKLTSSRLEFYGVRLRDAEQDQQAQSEQAELAQARLPEDN
jgi:Fur family ferric uptake transcriptional regulator